MPFCEKVKKMDNRVSNFMDRHTLRPSSPFAMDMSSSSTSMSSSDSSQGALNPPSHLKATLTSSRKDNIPFPSLENLKTYSRIFDNHYPRDGLLSKHQMETFFAYTGLSSSIIRKIESLVDTRQHSQFNRTEFIIAMHLVNLARMNESTKLPSKLPSGLYESATPGRGSPAIAHPMIEPSSEQITIYIREKKNDIPKSFPIYKNFITIHSPVLKSLIEQGKKEINIIANPEVFSLLATWLYSRTLKDKFNKEPFSHTLVFLWVLSYQLQIPDLCNQVIDLYIQQACKPNGIESPSLQITKAARHVYDNTSKAYPNSALRRLLTFQYAAFRTPQQLAEDGLMLPQQMVLDITCFLSSLRQNSMGNAGHVDMAEMWRCLAGKEYLISQDSFLIDGERIKSTLKFFDRAPGSGVLPSANPVLPGAYPESIFSENADNLSPKIARRQVAAPQKGQTLEIVIPGTYPESIVSKPEEEPPVWIRKSWQEKDGFLHLVIQYRLNPNFYLEGTTFAIVNLRFLATYVNPDSVHVRLYSPEPECQISRSKSLVSWPLGDVKVDKIRQINAEFMTKGLKPGKVEVKWEVDKSKPTHQKGTMQIKNTFSFSSSMTDVKSLDEDATSDTEKNGLGSIDKNIIPGRSEEDVAALVEAVSVESIPGAFKDDSVALRLEKESKALERFESQHKNQKGAVKKALEVDNSSKAKKSSLEDQRKADAKTKAQEAAEKKLLEEKRLAKSKADEKKKEEERLAKLKADEKRKAQELAQQKRREDERKAEEYRKAEEKRKADAEQKAKELTEKKRLEQERLAKEAKAKEAKKLEDERKAKEAKRNEDERLEKEAKVKELEAKRLEEQRKAQRLEEERLAKEKERKAKEAELSRLETERLAKEEKERQALEEARRLEDKRLAQEELKRLEQERLEKERFAEETSKVFSESIPEKWSDFDDDEFDSGVGTSQPAVSTPSDPVDKTSAPLEDLPAEKATEETDQIFAPKLNKRQLRALEKAKKNAAAGKAAEEAGLFGREEDAVVKGNEEVEEKAEGEEKPAEKAEEVEKPTNWVTKAGKKGKKKGKK